jgi:acyl carrier protein
MEDLQSRLVKCFKVIFPMLDEKEIRYASTSSVPSWDSVATVTLINVVEEEFNTQIDMQDGQHLTSFERFADYMRVRENGAAS